MPYPIISSRRISYDIDGTVVAHTRNTDQIYAWLTSSQMTELNNEDYVSVLSAPNMGQGVVFFFPEKREIELLAASANGGFDSIQGSNDTTNGMDGTWETASITMTLSTKDDDWRTKIYAVSFSTSYKVIRIKFSREMYDTSYIKMIHLYGRKAAGETVDDILFTDSYGNELTALMDWNDRPEGSTVINSFKVKNASTTKIANNVNLQLNHADFGMSLSESGPWTATIDISSIAANSLSATIYVRNALGVPPLALGPKAARCIVAVGSWT